MAALPLNELIVLGLFPGVLSLAIGTDMAWRKVPNALIAALVAGFAVLALSAPLPDLGLRCLACALALAFGFSLFREGVIGAGDAKLAGVLMLWLDPAQLPLFALLCGMIGALLTFVTVMHLKAAGHPLAGEAAAKIRLPYAVALAGAGLLIHPSSSLMGLLG